MKIGTRSKAVLAGALALGLGFVAAPAMAQEERISFDLPTSTFTEGDWGDGVEFTVSFDVSDDTVIDLVDLEVTAHGEDGDQVIGTAQAEEHSDGTWTGTVVPEVAPVAPDESGQPTYSANAYFSWTRGVEAGANEPATPVELTIVPLQDAEYGEPDVSVTNPVVTTDGWGDGVEAILTLPEGVTQDDIQDVVFELFVVNGEDYDMLDTTLLLADEGENGVYTAVLSGEEAPEIAESEDGPFYFVYADYLTNTGEVYAGEVELFVIDSELEFIGPSEASASELAEGVEVELRGFQPGEEIAITFELAGEVVDTDTAEAGIDGRTGGALTITGASPGEVYTVTATGAEGSVSLEITVTGTEAPQPTPPERVDTGL